MKDYFSNALNLYGNGTPFVSVSMVAVRGEAPNEPGCKAIMTREGLYFGSVGGGKVEARAIEFAKSLLLNDLSLKSPILVSWNLQKDIGMTCGGEVTYLFEVFHPNGFEVAVFGAGHIAQALIRHLILLDCKITCIDSRREWIDRLPQSEKIKAILSIEPQLEIQKFKRDTFFVVMTQGHATDLPILSHIFNTHIDPLYVGVIGSKIKGIKLRKELNAMGISPHEVKKLLCPIGLPLGSNSPSEIAISVISQILEYRDRLPLSSNNKGLE